MATAAQARDAFWLRIILLVSALICAAVAFLILGPRLPGAGRIDVSALPLVNASLNALTAVLLCAGYALIRARRIVQHRAAMLAAFASSSAFLVSYVTYHALSPGPRRYLGAFARLYSFILTSHVLLAAVILPLALVTLYRGWTDQRKRHRAIAKWTLPLWLYVSATGVVVYAMLYL